MDGWESRRRRTPGHDTAIIKLGVPGVIRMLNINTAHFTGNYPAFAKVWGCHAPHESVGTLRSETNWFQLTQSSALKGGSSNMVVVRDPKPVTHLKLEIFPAGGVARLRAYGDATLDISSGEVNLIGQESGAQAIACSDMYFSEMHNLLKPTPAANMGDGWETKRSRPPGDDWVIIKLGHAGIPDALEVDTAFFKGNYPQQFAVDALMWPDAEPWQLLTLPLWTEVIGKTNLGPDKIHRFDWSNQAAISHIRIRIYPDGGISRLRLTGNWAVDHVPTEPRIIAFNGLSDEEKVHLLSTCCGAKRWATHMAKHRALTSGAHLQGLCESTWWSLDESDWLEAFTHHPKIGENKAALEAKFKATVMLLANE
jgi:allantoicase